MKFHPFCEAFPLIEGPEFEELLADIKTHGLKEEILTFGGLILDGRNRARACQKANIPLRMKPFVGTEAQARALVVSANVHRRHLTASQRAFALAELARWAAPGNPAKGEPGSPPPAKVLEIAAEAHVSDRTMQQAKRVAERGSKRLKEAVRAGDVSIKKAAAAVKLPKAAQFAATAKATPPPQNDEPERPGEAEEDAALEAAERDWRARMDKVLVADDKLAEMAKQLKQTQDELTAAKQARDRYMNENAALLRQNKVLQRKLDRLEKKAA